MEANVPGDGVSSRSSSRTRRLAALLAALLYLRHVNSGAQRRLSRFGPRWLVQAIAAPLPLIMRLMGVRSQTVLDGVTASELTTDGPFVVTIAPHGTGVGHLMLTGPALVTPPLDATVPFGLAASVVFKVPLWRELMLLLGWREASATMAGGLLAGGCSVVVLPGGVWEMVETSHTEEVLRLQHNLGFVRLAMAHGRPLLPVYCCGETQLYHHNAALTPCRRQVARKCGFGGPYLFPPFASGRWGSPLPRPTEHRIVVGAPVPTGPPNEQPTDGEVLEVARRWCASMHALFARHGPEVLPPEVVGKGVSFVRGGLGRSSTAASSARSRL